MSGVTATISSSLMSNIRTMFELSIDYANTGCGVKHGNNAYTPHAFPSYIVAVAAVEAFLNESFLSGASMCKHICRMSALWNIDQDDLERMNLLSKVTIVPQMLFGASFHKDRQPYQDFKQLVRIRNDIVHFKMESSAPKYLGELEQKGIAITTKDKTADYPWPMRLSSLEGIRWAYNTARKTIKGLAEFVPEQNREFLVPHATHAELP